MKRLWILFICLMLILPANSMAQQEAVTFKIDPVHTSILFTVRHLMINKVHGKFKKFSGEIQYNEKDITKSSVKVTVDAASINTDNQRRDNDLRSKNFLMVEKYPEITFVSKKIRKQGDGFVAIGDLTLHGVTREVQIPFEITAVINDPWGNKRMGVEGSFEINRRDYDILWNRTMDNGGLVVGNKVKIEFNLEAIAAK